MKLDKRSSERLESLRLPLVIGVVFIHAYSTEVNLASGSLSAGDPGWYSSFVRDLISQGLAGVSVPLFFLMSGFFFFLNFKWTTVNYKKKLQSRFNSLVIPFLFWNLLSLLLYAACQYNPTTSKLLSGKLAQISSFEPYDYLNVLVGINRSPIAGQFWFIRDLIVLVLLTPLLLLLLKAMPRLLISSLLILWLLDLWPLYIPSPAAVLFFSFGAFLVHSQIGIFKLDKLGIPISLTYVVVLLTDVLTKGNDFNDYIHRIGTLLGVASALYLSKLIQETKTIKPFLLWTACCSFFVFAMHQPLMTLIIKIAYKLLEPSTDFEVLSLYFAIPTLTIAICFLAYAILTSLAPRFLSVITGGR